MASFDLEKAIADTAAGGVVRIPAGRYDVNVALTKGVTLIGTGNVVLDGRGQGPVVRVEAPGATVKLAGLMIAGGTASDAGGGVCHVAGTLELLQCTLRFNKAPVAGGGGLYVGGDKALVAQCRFEGNTGRQGAGVLVEQVAELTVRDSVFIQNAAVAGGALRVGDGAKVTVLGCTLADNKVVGDGATGGAVFMGGTTSRSPSLTLSNCILSERQEGPPLIFNDSKHPGALTVTRCLLPKWSQQAGDNVYGDPAFTLTGGEPYLLKRESPAVGAGDEAAFGEGAKDLLGRARLSKGHKPDVGAFALMR